MKVVKSEWDRFWEALGENFYMDDHDVLPEDESKLAPSDTITFTRGGVFWQGKEPIDFTKYPNHPIIKSSDFHDGHFGLSLTAAFKRWSKAQTSSTFVVEIPRSREELFKEHVKNMGGKVV